MKFGSSINDIFAYSVTSTATDAALTEDLTAAVLVIAVVTSPLPSVCQCEPFLSSIPDYTNSLTIP